MDGFEDLTPEPQHRDSTVPVFNMETQRLEFSKPDQCTVVGVWASWRYLKVKGKYTIVRTTQEEMHF